MATAFKRTVTGILWPGIRRVARNGLANAVCRVECRSGGSLCGQVQAVILLEEAYQLLASLDTQVMMDPHQVGGPFPGLW